MRLDASHPEQVAELLAQAAALIPSPIARAAAEHLHAEVIGQIEGEDRAWHRALAQLVEELEELEELRDAADAVEVAR